MFCIGFDTSNYTTSIAAVDNNMALVFERRKMLEVSSGKRGLRQSEAHFQHTRNIPILLEECSKSINLKKAVCICVSSRPRNADDSYMPVFTAGINAAKILGCVLKIPVFEISHQENHIISGMWSSKHRFNSCFFAYHISGGTTELLKVTNDKYFSIRQIGGSSDLKAGQFIDRVGVAMGLKFPCGLEMDNLCDKYPAPALSVPVSVSGSYASFSGPETFLQKHISKARISEEQKSSISRGIFECISKSVEQTVLNVLEENDYNELLLVGGVTSNKIIREYLNDSAILRQANIKVIFSEARFSPDNAVGTAVYGMKKFLYQTEGK